MIGFLFEALLQERPQLWSPHTGMAAPFAVAQCGRIVLGCIALLPVVETASAYAQTAGNVGNGLALGGFDQSEGAPIQPCGARCP
jgi:hypothetical protein